MVHDGYRFPLEGGCNCGNVRYRMLTEPMIVHCCHCRWCQRETGAAFAINAMIEADRVVSLGLAPEIVDTPSHSGKGQKVARCPRCRLAVWSNYAGMGPHARFVRTGTLDQPQALSPDIHVFTESKLPWVQISREHRQVLQFYKSDQVWSADSLARRAALMPQVEAYKAALRHASPTL
jgi:hypothetical protein